MPIDNNQIEDAAKPVGSVSSAPATGSGRGAFFVLDIGGGETEAAFADEAGNVTQITEAGALKVPPGSGEANTASNLGAGAGVFAQKSSADLQFKSIVAGANITVNETATEIEIVGAAGGSGETNTASNLGAGEGVFAQKSSADLQFKSLVAGTNVSIASDANTVTISASGGGTSVEEIKFTLPAAATLADRIPLVSGLPAGYAVNTAAAAADAQLGSDAEDLVITFPGAQAGSIAQDIRAFQITSSGPASVQGVALLSPSTVTDIKTNTAGTAARITLVGKGVNTTRDLVIYMKLI